MNEKNIFLVYDLKQIINTKENVEKFFIEKKLKWLNDQLEVQKRKECCRKSYENENIPSIKAEMLIYDTNDTSDLANIKNWLRYKIFVKSGKKVDCDCLEEVHLMYNMLLSDCVNENQNKSERDFIITSNQQEITLETDTMNSFAYLFNQFMRDHLYPQTHNEEKLNFGTPLCRYIAFLTCIDKWYNEVSSDKEFKSIIGKFNEFAKYTHCLANMILVPKEYNCLRASKTKDFWNLSLIDLQEIYSEKEHYDSSFTWFCENISRFLISDWFKGNFPQCKVSPLFKGQSFNKRLPNDIKEYEACLDKINRHIETRADNLLRSSELKGFEDDFKKLHPSAKN